MLELHHDSAAGPVSILQLTFAVSNWHICLSLLEIIFSKVVSTILPEDVAWSLCEREEFWSWIHSFCSGFSRQHVLDSRTSSCHQWSVIVPHRARGRSPSSLSCRPRSLSYLLSTICEHEWLGRCPSSLGWTCTGQSTHSRSTHSSSSEGTWTVPVYSCFQSTWSPVSLSVGARYCGTCLV